MTLRTSALAVSLALAAVPVHFIASASTLPDGGEIGAGVHQWQAEQIPGGEFVRTADGVDAALVQITNDSGLVIDGGTFRTAQSVDLTNGIELARGRSISLYNKLPKSGDQMAAPGNPPAGSFNLYTEDEVREIFASGDAERIRQAFTSADADGVPPQNLTEATVLAALRAANDLAKTRIQNAWQFTASTGDLVVNGGDFAFHSTNQNLIEAPAGRLVWNGGELASSGGGGDTILLGASGIDLFGGRILSTGTVDGVASAIQYDPRQRLDRDRWTLGNYLALVTDGDIHIGRPGHTGGPDIRIEDGMLKIGATASTDPGKATTGQHLNLHGGAITLEGRHRSTLLALERGFDISTVIRGGTLNVISDRTLIDTPTESPSMWNMRTVLDDGVIHLDNSQLIGIDSAINGGVVNLAGASAIYSPRGTLAVTGGTINVAPESFIGAIPGDNRARSPYPTTQHDLAITGGILNFRVTAPIPGQPLVVGTHIGGIYAGDNNASRQSRPTLSIGPDVVITVDTSALSPGTYTVADFAAVDADDGVLAIPAPIRLGSADEGYTGTLDTDGQLTLVVQ